MIIALDEGRVPWWRLLWSLLGALAIGTVGVIALMTDMNNPGALHVAVELIALPFVRPVYFLGGLRGDAAVLIAAVVSVLFWWLIIFLVLIRHMRKRGLGRPA